MGELAADGFRPEAETWLADVGTGSGILALGMVNLFGRPVAAVDPEPASRRAVARNCRLNPAASSLVRMVTGTHACLKKRTCSLMAANLPGPILLEAAAHLSECLRPGGWLIISGFRANFKGKVSDTMNKFGLTARRNSEENGWMGIGFESRIK